MTHRKICLSFFVWMMSLGLNSTLSADGLKFAIVAKSKADHNFVIVYEAAKKEAAKFNDTILFAGSEKEAHFRTQDKSIDDVLNQNIDGLAIAVLFEEYLSKKSFKTISKLNLPVVTYDSDFTDKYKHLRKGYIGTDNEKLGYELGVAARKLRPQGGIVTLMSGGPHSPNLNLRILGARRALSNDNGFDKKLTGEGGWTEGFRSPWYNHDDYDRALSQMIQSLFREKTSDDLFLSVGWWPQMARDYKEKITPYKKDYLDTKKKLIVCADGAPIQLAYLREGLSHVNVAQNFEEMGRLCYLSLKKIVQGETIPEYTYTPVKVFMKEE